MERSLGILRRRADRRAILPETFILAMICLLDLGHTVILVSAGVAVEANPLLAPIIQYGGWMAFAIVKAASFLVPLAILEWIRPLRPHFIRQAIRLGAIGYVLVYAVSFLHVNVLSRPPM